MQSRVYPLSLLAAAFPALLSAQSINGRVIDGATRRPLPAVSLQLLDGNRVIASAASDSTGRFVLRAPDRGRYRVSATHIGYANALSSYLELVVGEAVTAELALSSEPVKISPLTIDVPRDRYLESKGFYDRLQLGNGHFMTGEEVRKRNAHSLVDLLRGMRGVKIQRINARNEIYFASTNCLPMVILDGVTVRWGGKTLGTIQPLEDLVSVAHIDGIEAYRGGSSLPPEFIGPNAACGVLVIWTRHK